MSTMIEIDSLTDYERGWLVGIIEGEGSFGIHRDPRSGRRYPAVQIGMTDYDIIASVHRMTGATAKIVTRSQQRKENHKTIYSMKIVGRRAGDLMEGLLPYLGERRAERIRSVLAESDQPR